MMDVVTISVQGPEDTNDYPARLLGALIDQGRLPRFVDAIIEKRDTWTTLCWLEEDMLQFESRNRWCGATDGWRIAVGHCPELDDVPAYTGYGMQAWLLYETEDCLWAVTIRPAETRQLEEADDVVIWSHEEFIDHYNAVPVASVAFADDSGLRLNKAMREIRELEEMLH